MGLFPFGKYEVLEEIGRGGFGIVYRAVDTTLRRRPVALKVLAPHLLFDPQAVARFKQEAGLAATLQHRNIVAIYEVGETEGKHFLAMQLIEGVSLAEILNETGPLPLERVVDLLKQLADALDYAHAQGVVHRDIKPSNILIDKDDHVTLTDFGLAFAAETSGLTSSGQTLGTPTYMAPEQLDAVHVRPGDARSDIYSLGIVVYEMLAGRPPFMGKTPAVVAAHLQTTPPPITQFNPHLSEFASQAVLLALEKDPDARSQRAIELSDAVNHAVAGVPSRTTTPHGRPEPVDTSPADQEEEQELWQARNKTPRSLGWWLGAAGVALLGTFLLGLMFALILFLRQNLAGISLGANVVPTQEATAAKIGQIVITDTPALAASQTPLLIPTQTLASQSATRVPSAVPIPTQRATLRPTATSLPPLPALPTAQVAIKYPTASLIEPIWTDNQKDERKIPSQPLIFKWKAAAGLQSDECYRIDITFSPDNPGAGNPIPRGDYFLTNCGDSTQVGFPVQFQLNQPNRPDPNYGGLTIDASVIRVSWSVTIVKKTGRCVDNYHCPNAPLGQPGWGYFFHAVTEAF